MALSKQGTGAFNLLFVFHRNVALLSAGVTTGSQPQTIPAAATNHKSQGWDAARAQAGLQSPLEMVLRWQSGTNRVLVVLASFGRTGRNPELSRRDLAIVLALLHHYGGWSGCCG